MSSMLKLAQEDLTTAEETGDLLALGPCAKPAPRPLSLRSNFYWTFAGNVVYAGCQWGMLVVLAKLGSPERVGQFTLGLAVTAPVIIFSNLQLRAVQAIDARREYRFGHYLVLRLATTVLALFVIAGIACGFRLETALVILAIGLAKAFESFSDVVYGLWQSHERMDRIALSLMIKGPLSLAALAATLYFTGSIFWGALALAASWGLLLIAYDIPNGVRLLDRGEAFRPHWNLAALVRLARLALPLGVVTMLTSLNANIPRYFVERHLGEHELGIFAALAYLMVAGSNVAGALGQSASPRLARHYAEGDRRAFRRLLIKLVGLGTGIGASVLMVALVAGREILTILYRPEYADHADLLAWLMVAATVSGVASVLGYGMTAARKFREQTPLFMSVSVVSFAGCALLIPGFGLLGAAWSYVLVSSVQLSGSSLVIVAALSDTELSSQV